MYYKDAPNITLKRVWSLPPQKYCIARICCGARIKIAAAPLFCLLVFYLSSLFQQLFFLFHFRPLIGIRRRGLALDERLPFLRELRVLRDERLLRVGHVVLGENRLDRALGNAQGAV